MYAVYGSTKNLIIVHFDCRNILKIYIRNEDIKLRITMENIYEELKNLLFELEYEEKQKDTFEKVIPKSDLLKELIFSLSVFFTYHTLQKNVKQLKEYYRINSNKNVVDVFEKIFSILEKDIQSTDLIEDYLNSLGFKVIGNIDSIILQETPSNPWV
jgi:hypothetical protein